MINTNGRVIFIDVDASRHAEGMGKERDEADRRPQAGFRMPVILAFVFTHHAASFIAGLAPGCAAKTAEKMAHAKTRAS